MEFLYPLQNWIDDYVDIDVVADRKFMSYKDGSLDEEKMKDDIKSGYFTKSSSIKWEKKRIHRTQGMKMANILGA